MYFYWKARKENGHAGLTGSEKVATAIMAALAIAVNCGPHSFGLLFRTIEPV